jgi:[protein-PII] uridylyltransferase
LGDRFADLVSELNRPERLYLALLLHDLGKGKPGLNHAEASAGLADQAMARLNVEEEDREFVRFLIRNHLAMSHTMTGRDLSEPATIEEFAELVGTTDRLAALTLLTYADTSSVNPQAMTPWRAELLWQLYTATHNWLTQDAEDRRIHVDPSKPHLQQAPGEEERLALADFLEGFPQRYLRTCSPERVYEHFQLSRKLQTRKAAVQIARRHALYEVVVIAHDRPFLFASLCAALSSFGLNIERVEAFANQKGLVLDTFVVSDPMRTLDLNPNEVKRLSRSLAHLAEDASEPVTLPKQRRREWLGVRRSALEPAVRFDNATSTLATICHVIAEDRTGLLFDLASAFSQHECDIQVVLIDTQGHKAIDVFYVVGPEGMLEPDLCENLEKELLEACRTR